ncbi:MHS family MFS transporter [Nonomuraea sp. PA05]|uniref:MFS transporter n=1 Tax=Nonomuraea sp. PA05 TaxID=2604466 RepID=UPI0011D8FA74|nr:MFS transporter [Nonomuraea sp. PA05]TYB64878.1 MHS family MFS transporter [Nonomuraea sp. PA05]
MSDGSPSSRQSRRATIASFVGTALEWYDFFIYGTAAALVFGTLFFPESDGATGTLAAFATFWVGFLARPIGGILFGHLGDRLGRKNVLVITLVLMGTATTLIGVLPTYESIGYAAPLLLVLLRALQGIAVGGEWGGAVLMATESAGQGRRGLAGMWVQQGSPAGSLLATLVFVVVGRLPDGAFLEWGWRVPFLLSAVLVVFGLVVRLTVSESAEFSASRETEPPVRLPIVTVLRTSWPLVALGVGASALGISAAYFTNTFLVSWATTALGVPRQTMLDVLLITAIVQFLWQPVAGLIAHRVGALRVMTGALAGNILVAVPMFLLITTGDGPMIAIALALSVVTGASYYALLAGFLAQAFPVRVRYTGISLSYQLCSTIIGGSTPLVAQWLLTSGGGSHWPVVGHYVALLVLTLGCVLALARRTGFERRPAAAPPVLANS